MLCTVMGTVFLEAAESVLEGSQAMLTLTLDLPNGFMLDTNINVMVSTADDPDATFPGRVDPCL